MSAPLELGLSAPLELGLSAPLEKPYRRAYEKPLGSERSLELVFYYISPQGKRSLVSGLG